MSTRPKWIPVEVWAAARYDPVPSAHTLRRWCREGKFNPPADRVGGQYRVLENAEKIGAAVRDYVPLLERIGMTR